jgi:hypothetical protein
MRSDSRIFIKQLFRQIEQGHEMFLSIKQKEGLFEKNQEELRDMVG